ncbi:hypothetical protein F0L68_30965 [Solihabitans fulvus]|uniref:Uncharacterized protein n=1 Tax=Solihabitans fulvus TaxID=1892852 RepID=A0A5B2WVU5_9PSEU|nr:hypothetical protein [Solihabitans fulvus]KAA2254037.1 hypothetical protein F0L68_30965 [Solihabitans fulvus]
MTERHAQPGRDAPALDSAATLVRATAQALRRQRFSRLGLDRTVGARLRLSRWLPHAARDRAFAAVGALGGVPPGQLGHVDLGRTAQWVVDQYRPSGKRYPGVVIGASNGAAVHLCAALGMPWLPQTTLLPILWQGNDPDRPAAAMRFGQQAAEPLLEYNPDVVLHHVHDGNQGRVGMSRTTSFRLKWLRLPLAYQRFVDEHVEPGGPVLLLDCRLRWPATRVAERHLFQTGGYGGLDPDAHLLGSAEVAEFLAAQGSTLRHFDAPPADGPAPEGEWGTAPELVADVLDWAAAHNRPVHRISFEDPQALSAPTTELHREWLRTKGFSGDRLLVESYLMVDPVGAAKVGLVPFWTVFPVRRAQAGLQRYVADVAPVRELQVLLYPHGVRSAGWGPPACWDSLTEFVDRVELPATDRRRYPADYRALPAYGSLLRGLAGGTPELPLPTLSAAEVLAGLRRLGGTEVSVIDDDASDQPRHGRR